MVQKVYAVERALIQLKRPLKPKAWSHDDALKAHIGKKIAVSFNGGGEAEYVLLEADRYAFNLFEPITQSVVTVYKHAITAYRLLAE